MAKKIYFDGLNLALRKGTGITTYTKVLVQLARDIGHQTGILYSSQRAPARDAQMREIDFFDHPNNYHSSRLGRRVAHVADHIKYRFAARPVRLDLQGIVVTSPLEEQLIPADHYFLSRNLFGYADFRFKMTNTFLPVHFDVPPDIMHCTYQMPIAAKSACKIWTIHDLVPLRLPYATLDDKRRAFRLLRKIGAKADHIVTVSENSRQDIIKYLGVSPGRVTNTYQSVTFPHAETSRTEAEVFEELSGSFGLEPHGYLLFFGALEPKKNVARLLDAYLSSGVEIPLVLVMGQGWGNEQENKIMDDQKVREQEGRRSGTPLKRRIVRFEYVSRSMLVTLIRGARAVLFPSLYEGFGLPVLEAMALGTPVVTANSSSLPEVAGDAALLTDPYDTQAIAKAIRTIAMDQDLRSNLRVRGLRQAEKFSLEVYRQRMKAFYENLC